MPREQIFNDVSSASLPDLRTASRNAIRGLPESTRDIFTHAKISAHKRSERMRIDDLILEFTAPMCGHFDRLAYEPAFEVDWHKNQNELYEARRWINGFNGAVYLSLIHI